MKKRERYPTGIVKYYWVIMSIVMAIIIIPAGALATPVKVDFGSLNFSSANQGMWGGGAAPGLNINRFLGTSWNKSTSIGKIYGKVSTATTSWPHYHWPSGWHCKKKLAGVCVSYGYRHSGHWSTHTSSVSVDSRSGAKLDITTSGTVGLQLGLQADSGSVNTDVKYNASVVVPDAASLNVGSFFNLNPDSSLAGGSLNTAFPNIKLKLDAVVGVRAGVKARACVLLTGCTSGSSQFGFKNQTVPIVSFNQPGSSGKIKVLGIFNPGKYQFDKQIFVAGSAPGSTLARVTVHAPNIRINGGVSGNKLIGSGGDRLIKLAADLDGIALAPFNLPGLGVHLVRGRVVKTTFDGNLVNIQMGPDIRIKQNFEFNPSLYVNLAFDKPVNIAGKYTDPQRFKSVPIYRFVTERRCTSYFLGMCRTYGFVTRRIVAGQRQVPLPRQLAPQTSWFGRWDQLPNIALLSPQTRITPTFSILGNLLNNTRLGFNGIFSVDVLKATFKTAFAGIDFGQGRIGPLFSFKRTTNLFDTPPLFSRSFGLGGFNTVAGNSFMVRTASAKSTQGSGTRVGKVPEPAPTLLLIFGLIVVTLSRRKFS